MPPTLDLPTTAAAHPWWRRTLTALGCLLLGISGGVGWYHVSVQPGAAIVKLAFEAGPGVTPPADFDAIAATVTTQTDIPLTTPGLPPASLELHWPTDRSADSTLPMVLWIHGGGFVSSSAATVRQYAVMLAAQGYLVASLGYTLAPGARHPVPVQQGAAALQYLIQQAATLGGDPQRLFIGGDSAGAQIASELAAGLTNPALGAELPIDPLPAAAQLRGVILFCGLYDMDTVAQTRFPALRTFLWAYTGHRSWTSYPRIDQLSATHTATEDYPPTFISVGDADPFAPQADQLIGALQAQNVAVTALLWDKAQPAPELGHEYQFDFSLPHAHQAFAAVRQFLAERSQP